MVTRLYSPVYSAAKPAASNVSPRHRDPANDSAPSKDSASPNSTATAERQRELATVQDHLKGGKIQIDSILKDFKHTATALGADEAVQAKLGAYLQVVQLQGAEPQPNIPFIKNTLITASQTLDKFIATAAGKPSDVVESWVKTLLSQPVNYHSDAPLSLASPSYPSVAPAAETALQPAETPPLVRASQPSLEQLWEDAQKSPPRQAIALYETMLNQLGAKPEQAARVKLKLGLAYLAHQSPDQALPQLEAAYTDLMKSAPEQYLKPIYQLGQLYLTHAQPAEAAAVVSQTLMHLPVDHPKRYRLEKIRGDALQQLSNYSEAIQAYQRSLQQANQYNARQQAPRHYQNTIEALAKTYLSARQPEKALKLLQAWQTDATRNGLK
jgi:tetratricopeptide (TPR) repeat protein